MELQLKTKEQIYQDLESLKDEISSREYDIIAYRYGVYDGVKRTLNEIGKKFGVTRERIRQIEAKIMNKIKLK